MGICPDCETNLLSSDIEGEKPIQLVTQRCPNCDLEVPLALGHYPGGRYIGITNALVEDVCQRHDCDHDAVLRAQEAGMGTTTWYCAPDAQLDYLAAGRNAQLELV